MLQSASEGERAQEMSLLDFKGKESSAQQVSGRISKMAVFVAVFGLARA